MCHAVHRVNWKSCRPGSEVEQTDKEGEPKRDGKEKHAHAAGSGRGEKSTLFKIVGDQGEGREKERKTLKGRRELVTGTGEEVTSKSHTAVRTCS